jgi:hypothetical protein
MGHVIMIGYNGEEGMKNIKIYEISFSMKETRQIESRMAKKGISW